MFFKQSQATPTERYETRRRRICRYTVVLAVALTVYFGVFHTSVERFTNDEQHFKYGSIGSEVGVPSNEPKIPMRGGHLPFAVWKALPRVFPEYLPEGAGQGYERMGFLFEPGMDRPIGFSRRSHRGGVELLGLNCAVCHVSSVREKPEDEPTLFVGGPANRLNLYEYLMFIFKCAEDPRFHGDVLIPAMEQELGELGWFDELLMRHYVIPASRAGLLQTRHFFLYLNPSYELHNGTTSAYSPFGPGRVDTFGPIKALRLGMDLKFDEFIGTTDFPSIWNQRIRQGIAAHWDGNNDSVKERNYSAGLAAGAEPSTIDIEGIDRVNKWIQDKTPPGYPFEIDRELADEGAVLYMNSCASCHGLLKDPKSGWDKVGPDNWIPNEIGRVVPIDDIGTDPERLHAFGAELAHAAKRIGAGYDWQFKNFKKTNGYVNMPLDGIWLRAPYLHNGSVASMWTLLTPSERGSFYRGSDVYDKKNMGFVSSGPEAEKGFFFDVTKRGNSPQGHSGEKYGTMLTDDDKMALIEYLKQY